MCRVGVLEAFISSWSSARNAFGQGVPQTGGRFDQSAALQRMQSTLAAAAPGSLWTGAAADSYDAANAQHGRVFGQMAELDRKLSATVTESARIVSTGRKNLDAVRQWVLDAAASVPEGENRDRLLMGIVNNGLGQVSEIVSSSNSELARVGGEIDDIRGEYEALGNQRFGKDKEGPEFDGIVDPRESPLPEGPLTAVDAVGPGTAVPPGDPFVGNEQYGEWNTISTSPTGPWAPLKTGFSPFPSGSPEKVGPTTGWYTPNQTWISDEDAPIVQYKEGYRFRMAGVEDTPYTRVVYEDGQWQVQQWQANVYEYQKNTSYSAGGDMSGLPPIQDIDQTWERISLPEIAVLSAQNMTTTYYLPDGCGGTIDFVGGVTTSYQPPQPPIITRPR